MKCLADARPLIDKLMTYCFTNNVLDYGNLKLRLSYTELTGAKFSHLISVLMFVSSIQDKVLTKLNYDNPKTNKTLELSMVCMYMYSSDM